MPKTFEFLRARRRGSSGRGKAAVGWDPGVGKRGSVEAPPLPSPRIDGLRPAAETCRKNWGLCVAWWGIPEGCGRFDGNPRAGCPCGCKRRALGRLQRHGPGPQSASRPGNFQKLQEPERRASGSGPRLSAEALRSRGGRPAAALRFPEASAGRWDARPRRGAGAAQGRRGPLWEGFSAFLSRSGGSAPRIRRETWRPPAGPFNFGHGGPGTPGSWRSLAGQRGRPGRWGTPSASEP